MGEKGKGAKLLAGWELKCGLVGTRSQRDAKEKTAHNMNEGREERWSQVRQIKQGRSLGPGRRQGGGGLPLAAGPGLSCVARQQHLALVLATLQLKVLAHRTQQPSLLLCLALL